MSRVWRKAGALRSGQGERDHLAGGARPQQGDRPLAPAARSPSERLDAAADVADDQPVGVRRRRAGSRTRRGSPIASTSWTSAPRR